jgi:hypothetical protein
MIIFDVEIEKGILARNEQPLPGIEYCGGWRDFENMGVACVCTFDTLTHLSRVFTEATLLDLEAYLATAPTGGFNTRRFDMPLLAAHGVQIAQELHYDALEQIWLRLGLDADQFSSLHAGWGLDAVMQATFGVAKTGHGAMAPVWWQRGEIGKVIDYCLNDVWLEAKLCLHMMLGGTVKAAGKEPLQFERPRPTVAELEQLLKQEPSTPITINLDGSVGAP